MEIETLIAAIGLVFGLLGALAGIGAMIYALGYFEYLGGKKKDYYLIDEQREAKTETPFP